MARPQYEPWVREILRCPVGRHELVDVVDEDGLPALQCAQDCDGPGRRRRYPVVEGIPVLLADDATVVTVEERPRGNDEGGADEGGADEGGE